MIEVSDMVPIEELRASQAEEDRELRELADEAEAFLTAHKWCLSVHRGFLDRECESILAVFYFEIEPASADVDHAVWVIVGDLPPASMDIVHCRNGAAAIDGYVGAMREWVEHVRRGESLARVIPVYYRGSFNKVAATEEFAAQLECRLQFIEEEILPEFENELAA